MATYSVRNSKNREILRYTHHNTENLLDCEWLGLINELESASRACYEILRFVEKSGSCILLMDNRKQIAPTSVVEEWINKIWVPELYNAGIRYIAILELDSELKKIAHKKPLTDHKNGIEIRRFTGEFKARTWLHGKVMA